MHVYSCDKMPKAIPDDAKQPIPDDARFVKLIAERNRMTHHPKYNHYAIHGSQEIDAHPLEGSKGNWKLGDKASVQVPLIHVIERNVDEVYLTREIKAGTIAYSRILKWAGQPRPVRVSSVDGLKPKDSELSDLVMLQDNSKNASSPFLGRKYDI